MNSVEAKRELLAFTNSLQSLYVQPGPGAGAGYGRWSIKDLEEARLYTLQWADAAEEFGDIRLARGLRFIASANCYPYRVGGTSYYGMRRCDHMWHREQGCLPTDVLPALEWCGDRDNSGVIAGSEGVGELTERVALALVRYLKD